MNYLVDDIAERLDIKARKNQNFNRTILVKNPDGSNYDFTGHTVTLELFTSSADLNSNLTFAVGNGLTVTAGSLAFAKTAAQMNIRAREYLYVLNVTDASSVKKAWLVGIFHITAEQTLGYVAGVSQLTINPTGTTLTLQLNTAGGGGGMVAKESLEVDAGAMHLKGDIPGPYTISGVAHEAMYAMAVSGTRAWGAINVAWQQIVRGVVSGVTYTLVWGGNYAAAYRRYTLGGGVITANRNITFTNVNVNNIFKQEYIEIYFRAQDAVVLTFTNLPGTGFFTNMLIATPTMGLASVTIGGNTLTINGGGRFKVTMQRVKNIEDAVTDNDDRWYLEIEEISAF